MFGRSQGRPKRSVFLAWRPLRGRPRRTALPFFSRRGSKSVAGPSPPSSRALGREDADSSPGTASSFEGDGRIPQARDDGERGVGCLGVTHFLEALSNCVEQISFSILG
jgi:hypothetical protein